MPLPHRLGRFNRRVTNPILWPILSRLPGSGFSRVVHVGRRTGQVYRTPMLAFPDGERIVFALTYGADAQWVQNVLAAGACDLETRAGTHHLTEPRLIHDPARRRVPAFVRPALALIRADDFLEMRVGPVADSQGL